MGYTLCLIAFAVCWHQGRRSLVRGLGWVTAFGYAYGIVRARLPASSTYLLFDAAVAGFYLAWLPAFLRDRSPRALRLRPWLCLLVGWPTLLLMIPVQHPLVQLVGWRASAYFVPFLYAGARLEGERVRRLCHWIAVLNLVACGFALAEYVWGIEAFYPASAVTLIVHSSRDVAGGTAHRIPGTFSSSHAYAGVMVLTLPWLVEAWSRGSKGYWRWIVPVALLATVLGVLVAASRSAALVLAVLLVFTVCTRQLGTVRWGGLAVMLAFVASLLASEERLQRVTTLSDSDYVSRRLNASVRWSFLDLAARYPLGNGLGGGGTNLPHFLASYAVDPIGDQLENEYARILLEQGMIGLALWIAFLAWTFTRSVDLDRARFLPGSLGARLLWVSLGATYGTGLIGMGTLLAMPGAMLLFLGTGRLIAMSTAENPRPVAPLRSPATRSGTFREREEVCHA